MGLFDIFKRKTNNTTRFDARFTSSSDVITSHDATSFAAVDLIASSLANLSGSFYNTQTRQILKDYNLNTLINSPNYDETKFQFFYSSVKDYFNGNVYWYKYDNDEGDIIALFRLNPNHMRVERDSFNQKVFYYNGNEYYGNKILHIPSRYGYDGLTGKSIFSECNRIFSNSSELDSYINNSFNNNVGNRLVIDITKEFPNATEEQIQALRNKFLNNYTGIKNAGKPLIKSGKIEYGKIETEYKDNRANQLIENRQFQEKEVAKLFGVPLALLTGGEKEKEIESLYILFIENSIRPIATIFEQNINKLIPVYDRHKIFFEYSYNSLLKTSLQTRIDTYAKQLTNGILSPNEIRKKENLSEIEAGDTLFVQANLLPLKQEIINSYMAKSKLLMQEINTTSPNTSGDHDNKGDDKS
ncbi:MAG: phage portal protein [Treponema sp.]|nr:phage portal protein [Treponema sp.]